MSATGSIQQSLESMRYISSTPLISIASANTDKNAMTNISICLQQQTVFF